MKKVLVLLMLFIGATLLIAFCVWGARQQLGMQDGAEAVNDAPEVSWEQPPGPQYDDPLPAGAVARLGSDRFRHIGHVQGLAYAPDGKLLASGGPDATVRIWDAQTGQLLHLLTTHKYGVFAVAFSPDGKLLATGGGKWFEKDAAEDDCAIHVWDCATWKEQRRLQGHPVRVTALVFAPNGKTLASADDAGNIALWNPATGELMPSPEGHKKAIKSLAFSPDSSRLASASYDRTIRLWDVTNGKHRVFQGHTREVMAAVFAPDGQRLLSSSLDGTIRTWDVSTGETVHTLKASTEKHVGGPCRPLAISPDGKQIAGEGDGEWFCVWETSRDNCRLNVCPDKSWISAVAFAPDGNTVAAVTNSGGILRYRLPTLTELPRGGVHQGSILDVAFSPDGKVLATTGRDQAVWLWDVATRKPRGRIRDVDRAIESLAFSPSGRFLAGGSDAGVYTWRVRPLQTGVKPAHGVGHGHKLAFLPDGRQVVSYNVAKTRRLTFPSLVTFQEYKAPAFSSLEVLALSHDGELLAGGGSGGVRLWSVGSGHEIAQWKAHDTASVTALAFSPDGRLLASGSDDGTIRLWNVVDRESGRLAVPTKYINGLAFSPDGRWLASGGSDFLVRLWDMTTRQEVRPFAGHTGSVQSVRFSPDGKLLASGSMDSTVLLWEVPQAAK